MKNKLYRTKKKIIKSELEQNKVDIQIAKELGIKKGQHFFHEVKEKKPINVANFFIDDNDIFDSEEILMQIGNLLLILLTEQILLPMLKDLLKNQIG